MPNRKKMPRIREVKNLVVPSPDVWHLANGIPVYETNLGTQDILKLELVFFAGRPYERKKLASRCAAALMREGTKQHTSAELAETIDYYGGTLSMPISMDMAGVQLHTLTKHFDKLLPLVTEMLSGPTFPQEELDSFIVRNKQRLQVDLSKNDFVAYRKFTELLYGTDHPYGYNSYAETYEGITRDDLVMHFRENYVSGNCQIFLSGKTNEGVRRLLDEQLGQAIAKGERKLAGQWAVNQVPQTLHEPMPDTVQKAVRIGCHLFNRQHPDYNGMYVLNTILGGYFGSRLMTNIREEKGYTYNIYSSHEAMLHGGYFYVGTEVGNEFVDRTIQEIYVEMEKLQQDLVDEDEMEMVKNYLLGTLLTNLDGPFNIAEVIKTFVSEGLELKAFEELAAAIKNITAEEVRELARKYFSKKDMWEVVV
ncbi:MAG: insulinase family protein [Saprospiraceae bacterium]|nr:insulinase family protein [Saprospiraceae bacterium]